MKEILTLTFSLGLYLKLYVNPILAGEGGVRDIGDPLAILRLCRSQMMYPAIQILPFAFGHLSLKSFKILIVFDLPQL